LQKGKLIVFSAPSGSGKTTLVHHLLKQNLPLGFSISATSREPRGKEQEGVDYYFLSPDDFRKKILSNEFVEYEEVYPNTYYGTMVSEIERLWQQDQHILFDIDVVGGLNIKEKYPENTLSIFVQPPSINELEERLLKRGTDSEKKIRERLAKAEQELTYASKFDAILINEHLEVAKKEVVQMVSNFINP
jgi:guanylate kinase